MFRNILDLVLAGWSLLTCGGWVPPYDYPVGGRYL
jgi:hypothetical protein